MMKNTLCLLFVLAFIAQIAAIPADKAAAEAQAAAEKGATEAKKKAGDATAETEHKADAAKAAGDHIKTDAAEGITDAADKPKKDAHPQEHSHSNPHHAGKDFNKPQKGAALTAAVDKAKDLEKKLADAGAEVVKDFLGIFGF